MKEKVTCAERIRQGLELRRMTQKELCEKTGIPKSAMSQYCNGAFAPKQTRTALIARALKVSEAWLMGYDVPMNPHAIGFKVKHWKSDKKARLYMCIDSNLLDLIEIFAKEDGISLEDEIEKILHEETENRFEEETSEVDVREISQSSVERLYPSQTVAIASPDSAGLEKSQPEQPKRPTPAFEDGLDDSAECLMKYVDRLNLGQQQMLLDQARKMITPQTESADDAVLLTSDKKSPESEPLDRS